MIISDSFTNSHFDGRGQLNKFREWSLITGRGGGGLQNGMGGHVKFYPYEKGGRRSMSHSEGGAQKVLG